MKSGAALIKANDHFIKTRDAAGHLGLVCQLCPGNVAPFEVAGADVPYENKYGDPSDLAHYFRMRNFMVKHIFREHKDAIYEERRAQRELDEQPTHERQGEK